MIYTVTLNASIDYFAASGDFNTGQINKTYWEHMAPGGKGLNVSMVLNNLGQKNIALGYVAGFTGKEIIRLLDERKIDNKLIFQEEGFSRINVKIKSPIGNEIEGNVKYEETDLNGMGPVISEEMLQRLFEQLNKISSGDILILSGGKTPSISNDIYKDIVELMEKKGVKTVVDASGDLLGQAIESHPFLIKPNEDELMDICLETIKDDQDVIRLAKKMQDKGARNVLISRGEKGAILVTDTGEIYREDAPVGNVVTTIGAGDSLLAGFIDGYLKTGDYANALKEAVCAGSASAFSTQLATRDEVEALMGVM